MVTFNTAKSDKDLLEILELQRINYPENLTDEEIKKEGFVTVKHDFDILKAMNERYQHAIAKYEDGVVAYALVMLQEFGKDIDILKPMFKKFNTLSYGGTPLQKISYVIMGQICVAKEFRGQSLVHGLYETLRSQLKKEFDLIITEVATRNQRSIKAHSKVGFELLNRYVSPDGEEWDIIGLRF